MNSTARVRPPPAGFTFVELIVALVIGCLCLGVLVRLYSHFSRQGVQQDRQTVCWSTYCRVTEAIHDDLAQAVRIATPDPDRLVISTVRMDNTIRCQVGTVTWNLQDDKTVVRTEEGGRTTSYSFSGGLARQDRLSMVFKKIP